jgi:hypothetical protein
MITPSVISINNYKVYYKQQDIESLEFLILHNLEFDEISLSEWFDRSQADVIAAINKDLLPYNDSKYSDIKICVEPADDYPWTIKICGSMKEDDKFRSHRLTIAKNVARIKENVINRERREYERLKKKFEG